MRRFSDTISSPSVAIVPCGNGTVFSALRLQHHASDSGLNTELVTLPTHEDAASITKRLGSVGATQIVVVGCEMPYCPSPRILEGAIDTGVGVSFMRVGYEPPAKYWPWVEEAPLSEIIPYQEQA